MAMDTDTSDSQREATSSGDPELDHYLDKEATREAAEDVALASNLPASSVSGGGLRRRSFVRWAASGGLRVLYRSWTRVAARLFPEDSPRTEWATRVGISLPDRLNMSWVTPQLAVGGRIHPEDVTRLARAGVTAVVDTRSEYQDDEQALDAAGIKLLYLPTPDTKPLTIEDIRRGATWVNDRIGEGERVLIHCEHGVGRSVLLTAAALVARGMHAQEAIDLVQRRRWQAAPNHRQIVRLQEFEREMRATPSEPR